MRILALDLASVAGLCVGEAGWVWPARSVTLKAPSHSPEEGAGRLGAYLRDKIEESWSPLDRIVAEKYLDPSRQRNSYEVRVTQQMVGALHAIAACYGIPVSLVAPATVRARCCGSAHGQAGEETKAMVTRVAIEFGYLTEGSRDHNAADAALTFHWACWHFAQRWNHLPGRPHAGLPLLETPEPA
jgi:hypothetical protein